MRAVSVPLEPMLAVAGQLPGGPGWAYEFKFDGMRALAEISPTGHRLYSRSGADVTATFPELLPPAWGRTLLDGELVVLDDQGVPSFAELTQRLHSGRGRPAAFVAFDVLRLGGLDLTGLSYIDRRAVLEALLPAGQNWLVSPRFDDGPATWEVAVTRGLEGVVAKRLSSRYLPGKRSPDWVKVKPELSDDFVVGGWLPAVREVGSLLLGEPGPDGLVYRGKVNGPDAETERELLRLLKPCAGSPFVGELPRSATRGVVWAQPELVVEVAYDSRSADGCLRFPRLRRVRFDK